MFNIISYYVSDLVVIVGEDDESDHPDREPIGGTYAKLSNFETAGKAVCSKLREFTAKIIKLVFLKNVNPRKLYNLQNYGIWRSSESFIIQRIFRCCNDIVLEMVAKKAKETENNSGDNEYKDLKRLEV